MSRSYRKSPIVGLLGNRSTSERKNKRTWAKIERRDARSAIARGESHSHTRPHDRTAGAKDGKTYIGLRLGSLVENLAERHGISAGAAQHRLLGK